MLHRLFSVAGGLGVALWLASAAITPLVPSAFAQTSETKPAEKPSSATPEAGKDPQKVDEFAEAQHAITGPAGNPECVWLGRRVVSLLWRDDLDTAFRHLDLYDRFGCPAAHIQSSFRCLILHWKQHRPEGGRQPQWPHPGLLDQSGSAGYRRPHHPPQLRQPRPTPTTERRPRRPEQTICRIKLQTKQRCLEFATCEG